MHIVGAPQGDARRLTAIEVADLELAGAWVVDRRRGPAADRADRSGWVVEWEDDIVFLADTPNLQPDEASEQHWPLDAA
jgi:hypothetical protein